MNELRFRPKSDYLQVETWQGVYVLTRYWEKEMAFYKDELRFLNDLISKYFILLTKEANISKVQKMTMNVRELQKEQEGINLKIKEHLSDLNLLIQNAYAQDEQEFRDSHVQLEERITEFTKKFRTLKKEIFTITEHVIESEKLQHLLMAQ